MRSRRRENDVQARVAGDGDAARPAEGRLAHRRTRLLLAAEILVHEAILRGARCVQARAILPAQVVVVLTLIGRGAGAGGRCEGARFGGRGVARAGGFGVARSGELEALLGGELGGVFERDGGGVLVVRDG